MSVNSKMTAIADEVRELSGATEAMGLDTMASTLHTENTNFASNLTTQDDLIAQIQSVVDNLPEAGGGSSEPALQNKTVTPSTSSQIITADSGYDGLDTVTVNAIPSAYIKPTSTKTATTYTPTTTNQTIAAGTYCSGTQTIEGDSNLVSGNIKSGVSIFGVAGSYEGSGPGSGESGGSIKTCNLIISGNFEFIYNSISNGNIIGSSVTNPQNKTITVPCASLITVHDHQFMGGITEPTQISNMVTIHDGASIMGLMSVFQVSSIANSECSLMF